MVASVLPDGTPATEVLDAHAGEFFSDLHELSSDGRRAYFTAVSDGKGPGEEKDAHAAQVYLREAGKTTAVSISANTAVRDTGAKLEAASADGGRVFFVANYGLAAGDGTSTCLLNSINDEKDEDNGAGTGCDLYEYDVEGKSLTDLSADTTDPHGADVRGVLGISEDGSVVYFASTGQLLPGAGDTAAEDEATEGTTRGGEPKTEAEANVYAYSAGKFAYVATIGEAEAGGWNHGQSPFVEVDAISAHKGMHYYNARVSSDGGYLLLATRDRIAAYDNTQQETGKQEWEQYEYSLSSGTLSCATCNPSGEPPVADENEPFSPLGTFNQVQNGIVPRNLTNDGRVFFDTAQPLVASVGRDLLRGHRPQPERLRMDAGGPGRLPARRRRAKRRGCLGLLSSGTDPFPSYFQGASADAQNVYITTHAALVPQDQDGLNDIYDVRVDGGIPAPAPAPSCSAEMQECQPPGPGIGSSLHAQRILGRGRQPQRHRQSSETRHGRRRNAVGEGLREGQGQGDDRHDLGGGAGRGEGPREWRGLTSVTMSAAKAGTYKLKVSLTPKEKKLLRRKHKLKLKLRVSFAPTAGKEARRRRPR